VRAKNSASKAFTRKDGGFTYGTQVILVSSTAKGWQTWKAKADDPNESSVHGPMTPKRAYQEVGSRLRFFTNFKEKWVRFKKCCFCYIFFQN
jgi:hypothetical protein